MRLTAPPVLIVLLAPPLPPPPMHTLCDYPSRAARNEHACINALSHSRHTPLSTLPLHVTHTSSLFADAKAPALHTPPPSPGAHHSASPDGKGPLTAGQARRLPEAADSPKAFSSTAPHPFPGHSASQHHTWTEPATVVAALAPSAASPRKRRRFSLCGMSLMPSRSSSGAVTAVCQTPPK